MYLGTLQLLDMELMDLVKALRSPYRSLEHIAFTVKPICHVRQYFPVTGSLV